MLTAPINLGRSSDSLQSGGPPSHIALAMKWLNCDFVRRFFRSTQQRICSGFSPDSLFTEWHLVAMPSDTKVLCKFSETFLFYYLIVRNFSSPLKKMTIIITPLTQIQSIKFTSAQRRRRWFMVSTTQRERSDRCGEPPFHQSISFGNCSRKHHPKLYHIG